MKMGIAILAVFIFILCWSTGLITWIIMVVTQKKLSKHLRVNHPNIRNNLSFSTSNFDIITEFPFVGLSIFYKFGSKSATKKLVNRFVDIDTIDKSNDKKAIRLKNRLIRVNSNFARIWTIGFLSIIGGISMAIFNN